MAAARRFGSCYKARAMFIEPLESRIAPAGIIDIVLTGKTLIIKQAPGEDSEIAVSMDAAGVLTVDPDATTALRFDRSTFLPGEARTFQDFGRGISVSLSDGADIVTLSGQFPGPVNVDLGTGFNTVQLAGVVVTGAFNFKGGPDVDLMLINHHNSFYGNFTANFGDGDDQISRNTIDPSNFTVGKNLTVLGGAGFNDLVLRADHVHVAGNALFKGNGNANNEGFDGRDSLRIDGSVTMLSTPGILGTPLVGQTVQNLSSQNLIFVGGNVKLTSGDADLVRQDIYCEGRVHVGGSVSLISAKGPRLNPLTLVANDTLYVGKSVTVIGNDQLQLELQGTNESGESYIGGALTAKGLRGAKVMLDGVIAGKTTLTLGGKATVQAWLTPASAGGSIRLLGAVQISTPLATTGTTQINNALLESGLTIKDGAGARTVTLFDSSLLGSVAIDTGGGVDTVQLATAGSGVGLSVYGPVKILSGAGADTIALGGDIPGTGLFTYRSVLVDGGVDLAVVTTGTVSNLKIAPVLKNAT
jgi:hypothetical protein